MSVFPRPARPSAVIADAKRIWATGDRRYKLIFGALAIGMTSLVITGFILESRSGVLPKGPQLIYASDWPATRTDAEIKTQQRIDAMERRKYREERQRQWEKVDRQLKGLGI
jgi:hypothetical protein